MVVRGVYPGASYNRNAPPPPHFIPPPPVVLPTLSAGVVSYPRRHSPRSPRDNRAEPHANYAGRHTALEAGVVQVEAAYRLVDAMKAVTTAVEDTARVVLVRVWGQSRDAYHTASREAKQDKAVALAIAPVQALFAKTPRVTAAAVGAATGSVQAAAATTRAAKATQKAVKARQRAAALLPTPTPGAEIGQGPVQPGTTPVVHPTDGTATVVGTPGTPTSGR